MTHIKFKLIKNIDGVLGTRTQCSRMEGIDEFTELWRHPFHVFVHLVIEVEYVGKENFCHFDYFRSFNYLEMIWHGGNGYLPVDGEGRPEADNLVIVGRINTNDAHTIQDCFFHLLGHLFTPLLVAAKGFSRGFI